MLQSPPAVEVWTDLPLLWVGGGGFSVFFKLCFRNLFLTLILCYFPILAASYRIPGLLCAVIYGLTNSIVNYGNVCGALFDSTAHSISLASSWFLSRIPKCAFAYDSLIFMGLTGH